MDESDDLDDEAYYSVVRSAMKVAARSRVTFKLEAELKRFSKKPTLSSYNVRMLVAMCDVNRMEFDEWRAMELSFVVTMCVYWPDLRTVQQMCKVPNWAAKLLYEYFLTSKYAPV